MISYLKYLLASLFNLLFAKFYISRFRRPLSNQCLNDASKLTFCTFLFSARCLSSSAWMLFLFVRFVLFLFPSTMCSNVLLFELPKTSSTFTQVSWQPAYSLYDDTAGEGQKVQMCWDKKMKMWFKKKKCHWIVNPRNLILY